jgi:hypothetical protein
MEAEFKCPLCCTGPSVEHRIDVIPTGYSRKEAVALFRLICHGTCGEYDYSPSLFAAMARRPNWTADRKSLADGLQSGAVEHREFRTVMDFQRAMAEVRPER